jgi:hypothetical protein
VVAVATIVAIASTGSDASCGTCISPYVATRTHVVLLREKATARTEDLTFSDFRNMRIDIACLREDSKYWHHGDS